MSQKKIMVSVYMITYNHEQFISQAIEGVIMQQTNFPLELVIGEDCSTDNTRKICMEYQTKYPDIIRLLLPEKNIGMQQNSMKTFQSCIGKYIAICEGDDYWTDPYKLQKQVDFLESNEEYIITYHDFISLNTENNLLAESQYPDECKIDFSASELKRGAYILTLTLCFRNIIKEFPQEMYNITNGDTFLIALLGQYGKGRYCNDIKPAVYRLHQGGVWSSAGENLKRKYHRNTFKQLSKYFNRVGDIETSEFYIDLIKSRTAQYYIESLSKKRTKDVFRSYKLYFHDFKVYKDIRNFLWLNKRLFKYLYRKVF
jgi:glycosyltransferase involved in cell wall biosynthesis